jgi:hypothetical protein
MTLTMRELKGDDLFPMLAIVGKLNIKDDLVKIFERNIAESSEMDVDKLIEAEALAQKRGMEAMASLLQTLIMNLGVVKKDINKFLASLCEVPVKDIEALGLIEYTGLIKDFFKKKELADFFSSIASLMN